MMTHFNADELAEYEESLKKYWDIKGVVDNSFHEGEANKAVEIARSSLKEGLSIELISKITGLSVEEIEKLK